MMKSQDNQQNYEEQQQNNQQNQEVQDVQNSQQIDIQDNQQIDSQNNQQNDQNLQNNEISQQKSEIEQAAYDYISIGEPIVKDGIKKHVTYMVSGIDKNGVFQVTRRFNDFLLLREKFVERWPGVYIPYLPEKQAIGNFNPEFVKQRKDRLDQFCQYIFKMEYLFYSQEFQIFIRYQDVETSFKTLPKQTLDDMIQRYKYSFNHLSGKEITTELLHQIQSFGDFMKKSKGMLNNFREIAQNASSSYQDFENKQDIVFNFMVGEYEKNCLNQYKIQKDSNQSLIFSNQQNLTLQAYLKEFKPQKEQKNQNIFDLMVAKIQSEIRVLEAFQDAYNGKELYEQMRDKNLAKLKDLQNEQQNIMVGKKNGFKSMFGKSQNQDELLSNNEKAITSVKLELENLHLICDIVTLVLGYVELEKVKIQKNQDYIQLIKDIKQKQISQSLKTQEFWSHIGDQLN